VRIRCWKCGHTQIIFTFSGDRFGNHHGAICAYCRKPVTLKDCLFRTVVAADKIEEREIFRSLSPTVEKLPYASGATKPSGKR